MHSASIRLWVQAHFMWYSHGSSTANILSVWTWCTMWARVLILACWNVEVETDSKRLSYKLYSRILTVLTYATCHIKQNRYVWMCAQSELEILLATLVNHLSVRQVKYHLFQAFLSVCLLHLPFHFVGVTFQPPPVRNFHSVSLE